MKMQGKGVWKSTKRKRERLKRFIYQNKKEVQEQFERKMNQDVNGNRKLFWKEVSKANGGKVENSNRIKDGNGRLVLKEDEGFGRIIMRICLI